MAHELGPLYQQEGPTQETPRRSRASYKKSEFTKPTIKQRIAAKIGELGRGLTEH